MENIKQALDILELSENVEKLINIDEIVKLGLTSTPAVIINGKEVFHGKIPTVAEIEEALRKEIQ